MPDLTIAEAATALGVSADTIRRRIKAGDLAAHRDGRGRYVVTLPDEEGALGPDEFAQQAPRHAYASDAERELLHTQELLAEVRRQRDQLERQIEQDAIERAELRRLLGNAQQQLQTLLPAPKEMQGEEMPETPAPADASSENRPRRWRWPWQRG